MRKNGEFCRALDLFRGRESQKIKKAEELVGPAVTNRRLGNKYALLHFRRSYLDVGIEAKRPSGSFIGSVECGGALTSHVHRMQITKNVIQGRAYRSYLNENG